MESTLSLQDIIEQVSQEKDIDPRILVEATEQAILMAAKRTFGMERELEARFNRETGAVDLFQYMTVVEDIENSEREINADEAQRYGLEAAIGEELGFQIFYMKADSDQARKQDEEFGELLALQQHRQQFGRIAAQTAKQVIIQRVRDAERERIYQEYSTRKGEIITGIVRRFERGNNIIIDLGKGVEAILPSREQTPRESYRPGDRIVAYLKEVERSARSQQLIFSRNDVGMLVKLFEMEVPEIYEGIVRIVAAAREPGSRAKIAVSSRDHDVDPVGACVGMKGARVQAVVQELRGEKIDIVPWDRDPARFVCNAIAPAEVLRVVIDETNSNMELVVPDDKLSLAIGKRGQNVRLASKLTGWKLEIIGESRFQQIEEASIQELASVVGNNASLAQQLYRAGFRSVGEVVDANPQELLSIDGFENMDALDIQQRALAALETLRQQRLQHVPERLNEITRKERLLLVKGVTDRVAELMTHAGYPSPEDVYNEPDKDRFALKIGLETQAAQRIYEAAKHFIDHEWPAVITPTHSPANADSQVAS